MLGAALALLSAAVFGLNNAAIRRGVLSGTVLQAMAITVPIGVPLFLIVVIVFGATEQLWSFGAATWSWMAVAGVIHFVAGRYGNYKATQLMGAALSGPIQQVSIPIALVLAIVFLDEKLTPLRVIGIVLVMFGPMIILQGRKNRGATKTKSGFEPKYVEGSLWGLVGAAGYGTSPLLIRIGLEGGGLLDSIAAGFVSYLAAAIVVVILLVIPVDRPSVFALNRTAARWFLFSGVAVFFSQLFRYMALAIAPVTVVTTIQRTSVAFRALFGWMLNRDHEVFGVRTGIGIGLSLLGAVALSLSTDFVLTSLALPDPVAAFLRLSWP